MCVLFHIMFNAAPPLFGTATMTWAVTITANNVVVLVSFVTVLIYDNYIRI